VPLFEWMVSAWANSPAEHGLVVPAISFVTVGEGSAAPVSKTAAWRGLRTGSS
jgi:hypothetical protein